MITPTAKQKRAILSMATDKVIMHTGSVRSGKTVSVCFAIPVLVQRHRLQEGLAIICCKSLRNTELNVLGVARQIYGEKNIGYIRDKSYVIMFGEKFYILPFNDESSYQKIQGITVKLCIADEIVLSPENFFTMLLSRLSLPDSQLVATMNPSYPQHYIKRYIDNPYIDIEKTVKKSIFQWQLEDNPTLDTLYVSGLKNAYIDNQSLYRRYILGEWCAADGLAYFAFNDDNIVSDYDVETWRTNTRSIVMGIDPANMKDSTAAAPTLIDFNDNSLTLRRFRHNPKTSIPLTNEAQMKLLKQYINELFIEQYEHLEYKIMVVDCGASDFILKARQEFPDWNVIPFTKKDIQKRLDVCNNQLGSRRSKILAAADYDYYNEQQTDTDSLLIELQSVTIKDNPSGKIGLNPVIPNDVSDSWAYGIAFWYKYRLNPSADEE